MAFLYAWATEAVTSGAATRGAAAELRLRDMGDCSVARTAVATAMQLGAAGGALAAAAA